MRALLLLIAFVAGPAVAANLVPQSCTATNICSNVGNDGGLIIDYISDAIQYRRLVVSVNGEIYDSGAYALNGQMNQTGVVLYATDGSYITVTLAFTVTTGACVRQGRATVCPRSVHLDSGSIN